MKKKSLKSLSLQKVQIANFDQEKIQGGCSLAACSAVASCITYTCPRLV